MTRENYKLAIKGFSIFCTTLIDLKSTRLTINFKIKTTFFIRDIFRFFSNHFQTKLKS